nr:palmitoyltransferase ZDHHC16A-like [Cherax quadricarinatus]
MYMVYMTLGTIFIITLGFEIAYSEIWLGGEMDVGLSDALDLVTNDSTPQEEDELEGYPVMINGTHMMPVYGGTVGSPVLLEPPEEEMDIEGRNYWYRFSIMYSRMLTTGAFFCLGGVSTWHGRLISRGETNIEADINQRETERLAKINQA